MQACVQTTHSAAMSAAISVENRSQQKQIGDILQHP
jgi:hypothetical protein